MVYQTGLPGTVTKCQQQKKAPAQYTTKKTDSGKPNHRKSVVRHLGVNEICSC